MCRGDSYLIEKLLEVRLGSVQMKAARKDYATLHGGNHLEIPVIYRMRFDPEDVKAFLDFVYSNYGVLYSWKTKLVRIAGIKYDIPNIGLSEQPGMI